MEVTENLRNIASRQKELSIDLDEARLSLENSDFVKETGSLKEEIGKLRADFQKISDEAGALADENSSLKNALYEHVFNDKNRIVAATADRLNLYFRAETEGEINKLSAIEKNVKARIKYIKETLAQNNVILEEEFGAKLDEMELLIDKKVTETRLKSDQSSGAFSQEEREQLDALKKREVNDEQIRAVAKKNNLERFIGLNVLNVIGIVLLLIGAVTAARFTYMKLPDMFKGVLLFAFGGIMLVFGEILNRKKPNFFSLGISAGGIAILFVALAASYFILQIMGKEAAIALCVLLTVGAFLLSDRYNSQIVAIFALAGGYLPIISTGEIIAFVYGAMVYFAALNFFALIVSWKRKWRVMAFIGLSFNIIATSYICLFSGLGTGRYGETSAVLDKAITIIYAVFAFLIYTAIPIVSTYRAKTNFKKSDIVLLAVNTLFSGLIMYGIFAIFRMDDYNGLLAVVFAVLYLLLGRFIEKKFQSGETNIRALFYLTALAFVVLIIPLQFGRAWLSLGWLAEGVLLAVYGILMNEKQFKRAGFIICVFCLAAFLFFDFSWTRKAIFVWKYSAITLGSLLILGAYMYKKLMSGSFALVYKYFAVVNLWGYSIYIINKLADLLFSQYYDGDRIFRVGYLTPAASITVTFFIAYAASRIKLLSTAGMKILSVVMYCFGIIWMFALNDYRTPVASIYLRSTTPDFRITAAGTAILAVLGVLSVLVTRDAMKIIVTRRKKGIEWLPLVVSLFSVVLLSQNLIAQYKISFSSAAISIIYVLASLAWIIYGFIRRFVFIRRFGLTLAIFAVVKLFLVDLAGLTQGYRIVSYFALGITLLAISFVYQYFSKKLELKEGMTIHDEKN